MTSTKTEPVMFFKSCGVDIPVDGILMPDRVSIQHTTVENHVQLAKLRKEPNMCDVAINIGGQLHYGHRDVLASRIPFCKALFNSQMMESVNGEIHLSGESSDSGCAAFESLLDYAYTGRLTITTTNVQDLMVASNFLGMKLILDECADFLKRRLTVDNVVSVLYFCRAIAYSDSFILRFMDKNFIPISRTAEFLEFSVEVLEELILRDSLRIEEEKQVFEVVSTWINHDSERKVFAERLLVCVRLPLLTLEFITKTIEDTEWVKNNPSSIAIVNETKDLINYKSDSKGYIPFKPTERTCEDAYQLFLAFKDEYPNDGSSENYMQLYNPITNRWTKIKHQRKDIREGDETIFYSRHMVYFTRQVRETEDELEIFAIFNTATNEWHSSKLSIAKNMPCSTFLGIPIKSITGSVTEWIRERFIYNAGGLDEEGNAISDMQTYDEESGAWKTLAPMLRPRAYATSTVVNGKIYVLGGVSSSDFESEPLNCGEFYDPQTDRWTPISPMKNKRMASGSVSLHGIIYVVGGCDWNSNCAYSEVEGYDTVTDVWTSLKSMKTRRAWHSIDVSCGKIFVFGGFEGNSDDDKELKSVEMYDPILDIWEDRAPMTENYCCIPLTIPASVPSPAANLENIWINEFRKFQLKDELFQAIVEDGSMYHTYQVQSECLPYVIVGTDILCQAPSGFGKTTLSIIATLQQCEPGNGEASVLILCFTRAQSLWMKEEYERFSKYMPNTKAVVFLGGVSTRKDKDVFENDRPNIIIGTPTRIRVLIQSKSISLDKIKCLAIDNCDQVMNDLDMRKSVDKIVESTPKEKQIMLFAQSNNAQLTSFCKKNLRDASHSLRYMCA